MELDTAKTYKELQGLAGPAAAWLDVTIALAPTKTRALSAVSIAATAPTRGPNWSSIRRSLRKGATKA